MIKASVLRLFNSLGYQVIRSTTGYSPQELAVMAKVKGLTASSPERITGLLNAVKYLVLNKIDGDIVECGVWRGGSMMAAAFALQELGDTSRHIYLFDTYEGMTTPTDKDVTFTGEKAEDILKNDAKKEGPDNTWCMASLDHVQENMFTTGYPRDKIHFIKGRVEDTIPASAPAKIALLRLDTDWYESTAHELKHLYPRLRQQGVLILDDYGHWQGARRAVDEYFAAQPFYPLLNRLDYTGRLTIKSF